MNNTRQESMTGSERLKREKRLYEASLKGSVDSLKQLLVEDPLALARAALTCFDETPLHVAAMLGHLDFAKFLVTQKPDMAMAADSQGRSPLHLAAANGYVEMVNVLVSVNSNVCFFQDGDGRTPLHLAVMKSQAHVISVLVQSQPQVVRYRLDQGETLAHLAVKQNRLVALKQLFQLGTNDDLVNAKDDHGNTILHVAAGLKQTETIKYLLDRSGVEVLNAVNGNGLTALDIIEYMPRDLKQMRVREALVNSGALRARNIHRFMEESDNTPLAAVAEAPPKAKAQAQSLGKSMKARMKNHEDWLKEKRDTLMIVATVIAAMAYQAGLNPPSGVWGEDTHNREGETMYLAGLNSIMAFNYPKGYPIFMTYNTVSFVASLSVIFLLISGLPMKKRMIMWVLTVAMWVAITFMALTYLTSMLVVSPYHEVGAITNVVVVAVLAWMGLMAIVILGHTYRFLEWCVRKVRKLRKKEPSSLA